MYCSQCGTFNESTAHFCKNCGASLVATDNADKVDILEIPQPQPVNPFTTLLFWGALLVVIGFFLPWFSLAGFLSFNGWNISGYLMQIGDLNTKYAGNTTLYSIMLYLMPIASVIVLIALFSNAGKTFFRLLKLVPLIVVLAFITLAIMNFKGQVGQEVFRFLGIGVYITILGTLLLAFAPVKKY